MDFPLQARVGQKLWRTVLTEIESAFTDKDAVKLLPHYLLLGAHLDPEWKKSLCNSPVRPVFQRRLRAVLRSQKRTRREVVERCLLLETHERWGICSHEWLRELQREIFSAQAQHLTSSHDLRSSYEWLRISREAAYAIAKEELREALEAIDEYRALALISFIRYGLGEELPDRVLLMQWMEHGLTDLFDTLGNYNIGRALSACRLIDGLRKSIDYTPSIYVRRGALIAAVVCRRVGSEEEYMALRNAFKLSRVELLLGRILSLRSLQVG